MSYKKIVAGIATAAIASALIVPAAFAASWTEKEFKDNLKDYPCFPAEFGVELWVADVQAAITARDADLAALNVIIDRHVAFQIAFDTAVQNGAATFNYVDENGLDVIDANTDAATYAAANNLFLAAIGTAQNTLNASEGALSILLNSVPDALDRDINKVRKDKTYVAADKSSMENLKKAISDGKQTLIDLDVLDFTSLQKNYEQQVRLLTIKYNELAELIAIYDDADMQKCMNPNERQAVANQINELIAHIKAEMAKIPDSEIAKAKKEEAKKDDKKSGLPKTSDVAPVAPIAAVAGSAALIAAGLVASRKVNA